MPMSTCEEARTEAPVVISTMAGEEEEGGSEREGFTNKNIFDDGPVELRLRKAQRNNPSARQWTKDKLPSSLGWLNIFDVSPKTRPDQTAGNGT
ncbi:unnamed protein product [Fusarium graminearum]|nr:unnamed protein product [Fusarium graminearum]